MRTITAMAAKANLERLLDEVAATHEPVLITGQRANAVLVLEEDWRAIIETMYLLKLPGMRESIIEGLQTPLEECEDRVDW